MRRKRCPECGSFDTRKHGKPHYQRRRENGSGRETVYKQNNYCNDCGRQFRTDLY